MDKSIWIEPFRLVMRKVYLFLNLAIIFLFVLNLTAYSQPSIPMDVSGMFNERDLLK